MYIDRLLSMSQQLIWVVWDQRMLRNTGQRHNRVWYWYMHLSRSLSGRWMTARNSAALRGFLLAAPNLHVWLYRADSTLGPFFLSVLWLPALICCLIAQWLLPFTAWYAIYWKASGHGMQRHTVLTEGLKLKWFLNNITAAFSMVHQRVHFSASTPLGPVNHLNFRLTSINKHFKCLLKPDR